MVLINIAEPKLDSNYWQRVNELAEERVSLPKDSPEIKKQLLDADCALTGFAVNIDREILDSSEKLKYIGVLATAYGAIDVQYTKKKGIVVSNIPGYSTESVAEFVFATILERIRELEKAKRKAREGNYSESEFAATEIKGKTYGIIGLGRIGSRVAELALGFGANVIYWSRNRKKEMEAKGIKYEDADSVVSESDFLSMHVALTEDTKQFLNERRINMVKKGAIVINTAGMELIDIESLERRMRNNDMTFILDYSDEMMSEDLKRLSRHENCIIYPPIAYISQEARIAKQEIFVNNIENFLKGSPTNRVN